MTLVNTVGMAVVEVIGVVVVGDRDVAALSAMVVVVACMGLMGCGGHVNAPLLVP